jgi:hypothetical protein
VAGSASCVTGTAAMAAVPDVGTLTNMLTSKWVWQLAQYFTFQRLRTASVPRETCFPLTLPEDRDQKRASDSCSVDPGDADDFGRGSRRRRHCGHGLVRQRARAVRVAQLAFDIEAVARGNGWSSSLRNGLSGLSKSSQELGATPSAGPWPSTELVPSGSSEYRDLIERNSAAATGRIGRCGRLIILLVAPSLPLWPPK